MTETPQARRTTDSTWYRVLDRFGLPTLFAVLLLGYVLRQGEADAKERRELLTRIAQAVETNTAAMRELAHAEQDHALAVRTTWPKVKEPPPHKPLFSDEAVTP